MTKRLTLLLLTVLLFLGAQAQQPLKLQFINQYEAPVHDITVLSAGQSASYETDQKGFATVIVNPGDSITFSSSAHEQITLPTATLSNEFVVTLKKDFTWKDLINPMFYIIYGGLFLLLFIVFAETGLFIGFFLPGDSLLFVAGIYSTNLGHEFLKLFGLGEVRYELLDLLLLVSLISLAGIIGNSVGYWFGRKIGPTMFNWRDRFLFKKKYLYDAHEFYEKHGGGAVIFARFLPIIRTFAPIIAGIVGMERKKFMFFNIVGCVAWVFSMILAGHFLQKWIYGQFGFDLKKHLEFIVLGIVIVTTAPVLIKLFTNKKKPPTTN